MTESKRRFIRAAAIVFALSALVLFGYSASSQQATAFRFALIGDLGYNAQQEPWMEALLADINATPGLAFVVHDGDLSMPPQGSCKDEMFTKRLGQFQASVHPFIYTPGDNEWTDCHAENAGGYDPLERLSKLRQMFFATDRSLGQRTIPLARQSDTRHPVFSKYRENARWQFGEVTFLTLHMVGSNNNLGRTPEMDAEHAERDAANVEWLRLGFEEARQRNSRAVMIITQANIFPTPARGGYTTPFFERLVNEVLAFRRPVVLVHGDTHTFRIDKSLVGPTGRRIENFTRVETFGQPDHHWVDVTVDYADPNVFVFRQKIVEKNLVAHVRR